MMPRRKISRKSRLLPDETQAESSMNRISQQYSEGKVQVNDRNAEIKECGDHPGICGKEAACLLLDTNTSMCVCPHDRSAPTSDLRCPNRSVVPKVPQTIPNLRLDNGTNSTYGIPEAEQVEGLRHNVPEIVGVTMASIVIIIILLGIVYGIKRRTYNIKSQRNSIDGIPMNLKKGLLANKYTPNPQYFPCGPSEIHVIPRENLIFLHDIGEGCFGKVYKGEWYNADTKEIVAIKVLKDTATREAEEDFIREVNIMSAFEHKNILSLKGVVLRDAINNPWIVFEYMSHGDLAHVLRANSRQGTSPNSGLEPLTKESLHWIALQIAAGMTYLSSHRFVHRDLACRNCLVSSGLIVKIADFGMSRDIYTCDYYKIGGSRLLPVRWMSPESLIYGRFTLETDIWSFGVVLWEIFSYGKQPYYGHNNEEVIKLVLHGIMLIPPDECPTSICEIMRECWKTEANDRITFPEILDRLEKLQDKLSQIDTLPRPPQGPVTICTPDLVDTDGYLLPTPAITREYLQTLPPLFD